MLPVFVCRADENFIEFLRKYGELYDSSNKKCSDSVWEEKLWGQIGDELKKIRLTFSVFYCSFLSYYHSIIIEVLIINK